MMQVLTVTNQKGGVGKSTISAHLAMALREIGERVVFIDLDPQANSSKSIELYGGSIILSASQLFSVEPLNLETLSEMALVAADPKMIDIERIGGRLLPTFKRQIDALSSLFDYCVIDTPPTLGFRMTAALAVAHHVLSPIELEEYSIDGITKMLQTIFGVKTKLNPQLNFLGMLPNRFNARSETQKKTIMELFAAYPYLLLQTKISTRSSIPDALEMGLPVWALKRTSAREAAKEFKSAISLVFQKMNIQPSGDFLWTQKQNDQKLKVEEKALT